MEKKLIIIILAILIPALFVGCNFTEEKNVVDTSISSTPAIVTKSPTKSPTLTPTTVTTKAPSTQTSEPTITYDSLKDLSGFKAINDCFISTNSNTLTNENSKPYFDAKVSADLNKDGKKDDIHLVLSGVEDSYIEVNQTKLATFIDRSSLACDPVILHLVDLDRSDSYTDIACLSKGPGGVCNYQLFRYDGSKLYFLGETLSETLINESGKLIPMTYYSTQFKPLFCSAWYEIKDNTLVLHKNDTKELMNQSYAYEKWEVPTFFMPCETIPTTTRNLKGEELNLDSCQITILDVLYDSDSRELNYYFVQLPTGEKGLLYFNYWP